MKKDYCDTVFLRMRGHRASLEGETVMLTRPNDSPKNEWVTSVFAHRENIVGKCADGFCDAFGAAWA